MEEALNGPREKHAAKENDKSSDKASKPTRTNKPTPKAQSEKPNQKGEIRKTVDFPPKVQVAQRIGQGPCMVFL